MSTIPAAAVVQLRVALLRAATIEAVMTAAGLERA